MGRRNLFLPLLQCDTCDFSTKNTYIYKRHRIRCRREQGVLPVLIKSEPTDPSDSVSVSDMDTSDMAPPMLDYEMPIDQSFTTAELEQEAEFDAPIDDVDDQMDPQLDQQEMSMDDLESNSYKLPPPSFNRNYQCPDCNFITSKSKMFLYHQIDVHKYNFNIYPCVQCEYASRYKHKIQRHLKLAHKAFVSSGHLSPEFVCDTKSENTIGQVFSEQSDTFVVKQSKTSKTKIVLSKKIKLPFTKAKIKAKTKTKFRLSEMAMNEGSGTSAASAHLVRLPGIEGRPLFKCKLCLFNSDSRQKVYKHIHTCHINAKTYFCGLCNFSTTRKIEMYTHKATHTGVSLFRCEECTYSTDSKPNFDRHMINHTKKYSIQCDFCSYSSDHIGALKRHMANNHQNSEENISIITAEKEESDHDTSNESAADYMDPDSLLDSNKRFRCRICELTYKRSGDLNRHMKLKHNLKLKDFLRVRIKKKKTKIGHLKAAKVAKVFSSTTTLEQQPLQQPQQPLDLSVNSPTKLPNLFISKERLKCSYCSYLAKWPSDLRRHEVVHCIEKRYKCPHCLKKYKYIGDLNVHLRRDHKKEPGDAEILKVPTLTLRKSSPAHFKCPSCPYTTVQKSDIDRHSRLHKNGKPYHCNFCEYQTHWKGDIRRHVYKRHPAVMAEGAELEDVMTIHPENFIPQDKPLEEMETAPSKLPQVVIENVESNRVELYETIESPAKSPTPSPLKDNNWIFRCEYCEFTTNAPSKLKCHVSTHLNLKQYQCPICGRRANWKWDVRKHIRKDHPETSLDVVKLSIKEAEATIKEYLETNPTVRREHHLNTMEGFHTELVAPPPVKRNYRCSACPFRSSHRWAVSRHIRTVHEDNIANVDIVTEELDEVPQEGTSNQVPTEPTFLETSPLKVLSPVKNSSPEKLASSPALLAALTSDKPAAEIIDKPFMCVQCGKRSNMKGDVKKHYMYVHPGQEVRIIYLIDGSMTVMPCTNTVSPAFKSSLARKAKALGTKAKQFSSAKAHGYIKPFKCSVCGHRSNWKWDLNKHILSRHPGERGCVITLSIEDARATYAEECMQQTPTKSPQTSVNKVTSPGLQATSPVQNLQRAGAMPSISVLRQFKCSACPYRTNWRNDLHRHINRKHGKTKAHVIYLDAKTAKETLADYKYNPKHPNMHQPFDQTMQTAPSVHNQPISVSGGALMKVWKCSKCSFSNKDKMAVVSHLSLHNIKAFRCTICGHSSNYRSAMYRHLRGCHGQNDISFLKCGIRCVKESAINSEQSTVESVNVNETMSHEDEKNVYQVWGCYLCSFQSNWRSCVCRHLREKHAATDYTRIIRTTKSYAGDVIHQNKRGSANAGIVQLGMVQLKPPKVLKASREKRFRCHICPFRSNKRTLLHFHVACHKPRPGAKQVKCKHCPYWVRAERLLSQHTRLHFQTYPANVQYTEMPPPLTPVKHRNIIIPPPSPKKHHCEKCPYSTNSKNDFLYHKQFHRPKPAAEFKCEHCDYWVTHKRLLKQHTKLHEDSTQVGSPGVFSAHSSPCKSDFSECSLNDMVEIASIKQRLISSKITSSLSQSPAFSPMKLASQCSIGGRPGYVLKNGVYKKLHKCRNCPYMNVRTRNLKLHEMMHGARMSDHPLMKCPHCDYHVGSKGLLSHHLKVHQPTYTLEMTDNITELEKMEGLLFEEESEDKGSETSEILYQNKVDTLLEIARFKKYSCEKCPYASAKRAHFERHSELHGSKQRHVCEYCDYSVPSYNLLVQHRRLHMMPNQNLLAAQSISNLQHLPEVPADVALASALPVTESGKPITVSITHDHIELYENTAEFNGEPKKLYRCDRCPYANVRRDHLLTHLKFHMLKSELACPYCDYSVSKQHLLAQHIKIHFSPLPELSTWLAQNGQMDRVEQTKKEPDISEALEMAQLMQNSTKIKQNEQRDCSKPVIKNNELKTNDKDNLDISRTVAIVEMDTFAENKEKDIENIEPPAPAETAGGDSKDLKICGYDGEKNVEMDDQSRALDKSINLEADGKGNDSVDISNMEQNGAGEIEKMDSVMVQTSDVVFETVTDKCDNKMSEEQMVGVAESWLCEMKNDEQKPVESDEQKVVSSNKPKPVENDELKRVENNEQKSVESDEQELLESDEQKPVESTECENYRNDLDKQLPNTLHTTYKVSSTVSVAGLTNSEDTDFVETGVNKIAIATELAEGNREICMDDSDGVAVNKSMSDGTDLHIQETASVVNNVNSTREKSVPLVLEQIPAEPVPSTSPYTAESSHSAKITEQEPSVINGEMGRLTNGDVAPSDVYICQYCDREFLASDQLLRHEMQHLIGNHFEVKSSVVCKHATELVEEMLQNGQPMDLQTSENQTNGKEELQNIKIKEEPMDLDEYQ